MRILTFTSLYPSEARPRCGIFVETKLAAMHRVSNVTTTVVAPVPWFPFTHPIFGNYAQYASTARAERRLGIQVFHPRYLMVPRVGMLSQPITMAIGASRTIARLRQEGFDFDVIDAHYFYPDGVAAAIIAHRINKPLVITARGSDVNLLASFALPRRMIVWAAREAGAIVTVSAALKDRLGALGVQSDKINVIRNGVDTERFVPVDKSIARKRLAISTDGPLVLSIGNLVPEKGHDLLIATLSRLPGVRLIIVGEGPLRSKLLRQIGAAGVADRVSILPPMQQRDLKWIYGAADLIALASIREGIPNVLLEALSCGRPIVAAAVGGVPEIVTEPVAGIVVSERSPIAFARAIDALLRAMPATSSIREFAERFGWNATARAQVAVLECAILSSRVRNEETCHA